MLRSSRQIRLVSCAALSSVMVTLLVLAAPPTDVGPGIARGGDEKQKAKNKKLREGEDLEKLMPPPAISHVFPAGGQAGTSVGATVTGSNLLGSEGVRVTGGGIEGRVVEVKDATTVAIELAIAPEAARGERDLRLIGPGGVSNRFRVFVGELPEVLEVEPNTEIAEAQPLDGLPRLVNGQIMESDRDCYRFEANAGQTIVCDLQARRILPYIADGVPSWLEASLTLFDPEGRKLAFNDDFRFRPDPLLIFPVPADGTYVLEVKDELHRGRGDFVYRLAIGELPYLTSVYPLGGPRGATLDLTLRGVNLDTSSTTANLAEAVGTTIPVAVVNRGVSSNELPIAVGDDPEVFEIEPNQVPRKAQKVDFPVTINGQIQDSDDVDVVSFDVKKGQTLTMEVQARRLESPLDAVLTLTDERGRRLAEADDTLDLRRPLITHHADPRILHRFTADGTGFLTLRDSQRGGSPEHAYRLTIAPARPDFSLRVSPDNLRLGPGETAMVTVNALRQDGFNDEIALTVSGLPEGFVVSEAVIPNGSAQTALTLTAPEAMELGVIAPVIEGHAQIDGQEVVRQAEAAESVMQAFTWTHIVPTQEYSVAVVKTPPVPFRIEIEVPENGELVIAPGAEYALPIRLTREEAAAGPVSVIALGLPPGITARAALITPEQDAAELMLTPTPRARVGLRQNIVIQATMRTGRSGITRVLPAVPLAVREVKPNVP